jgi:hypothetical protein
MSQYEHRLRINSLFGEKIIEFHGAAPIDSLGKLRRNYLPRMADDNWESRGVCNHPKVEIDAWGQRLHGCIQCNQWMSSDGEWQRLPDQDIAALRGLRACIHKPTAKC